MNKPFTPRIIKSVANILITENASSNEVRAGTVTEHPDGTLELCLAIYPTQTRNLKLEFLYNINIDGDRDVAALIPTQFGDARYEIGVAKFNKNKADISFFALPANEARIVISPIERKK